MEITTVLWREFIFFKRRFFRITASALINPVLYLIAFGWGLGKDIAIEGATYMHFVIPGIIALTTMNTSFSALSTRINISRIHEKSFEFYLTSPVNMYLLALGHILAGTFRGIYAAFLIWIVSLVFGVYIKINLAFILICFLNSFIFAAFAYGAALSIDSHYDMSRFTVYVLTPVSFLCGTFFSVKHLPHWAKLLINILPLTHASVSLRSIALEGTYSQISIIVLLIYSIIFYFLGVHMSYREI